MAAAVGGVALRLLVAGEIVVREDREQTVTSGPTVVLGGIA